MNSPEQSPLEPKPSPRCQRRALLFALLSVLWLFPSIGAIWILSTAPGLPWDSGLGKVFSSVRFEQWVALALLGLHALFIYLAIHYRRTEVPVEMLADPDEPGHNSPA